MIMEFKIDTKTNYTVLSPVSTHLDVNLTASIRQKWNELTESGRKNLIVDFHTLKSMDESAPDNLAALHQTVYSQGQSLVFSRFNSEFLAILKSKELDLVLNIAPTMEEAVDIVSMEILERDLFNEEED